MKFNNLNETGNGELFDRIWGIFFWVFLRFIDLCSLISVWTRVEHDSASDF